MTVKKILAGGDRDLRIAVSDGSRVVASYADGCGWAEVRPDGSVSAYGSMSQGLCAQLRALPELTEGEKSCIRERSWWS